MEGQEEQGFCKSLGSPIYTVTQKLNMSANTAHTLKRDIATES